MVDLIDKKRGKKTVIRLAFLLIQGLWIWTTHIAKDKGGEKQENRDIFVPDEVYILPTAMCTQLNSQMTDDVIFRWNCSFPPYSESSILCGL